METLLLSKTDITELIDQSEIMAALEDAFRSYSSHQVEQPGYIRIGVLLAGVVKVRPDEKVATILTGGNWDMADLATVYAGQWRPER